MFSQKHDILNKTNFWWVFTKRNINFEPGKGKEIMKIQYKGFMRERIRRNPVTIDPDASFFKARDYIHAMGIRHLPVVDKNNRLVGIVTDRDIREAAPSDATSLSVHELSDLLEKLKVSAFMTPKEKLITITPDTLIEEAVQLMHDHKIGCLPVLEGGKLYGIFTETDALDLLVDVFGFKEKGTRLTIALEDKPGTMLGVLEILEKHKVNVISIVSPSFMVEGKRVAAIRIKTEEYKPVVKNLEKAGYTVLSIGKWSPT
jgi:acetoin utilization protein AcuB